MSFKKKFIVCSIFLLLISVSVLDVLYDEFHPYRFIAVYIQGLILAICLFYGFKSFVFNQTKITLFHYVLVLFVGMIAISGLLNSSLFSAPVFIYGVSGFFLFYYLSYYDYLSLNHIRYFSFTLLLIFSWQTYLGLFERTEVLEQFYFKADNVGYNSLFLMLLFSLNIKGVKDIVYISVAFILVVLSFKRGAILIATVAYAIILIPVLLNKYELTKRATLRFWVGSLITLSGVAAFIIKNWNIVSYRFMADPTGSGRAEFYYTIFEGWKNSDAQNLIFGHGLMMVSSYLGSTIGVEIYAHSDWLQVLFDHGILGIIIYMLLIFVPYKYISDVKKNTPEYYYLYIAVLVVWLIKSIVSGVYINKGTILLMIPFGIILGNMVSNKRKT